MQVPIKYIDTTEYVVKSTHDEWADNPTSWGNFKIVTFGRGNLITDTDIEDYLTENGKLLPSIQAKLRAGKAFWIDIYEHGETSYSLHQEGMQSRFDTTSKAGIIFLDDSYVKGVSYDERKRYAREDLKTYASWANGYVYGVDITTKGGKIVDACTGFYGYDSAIEFVEETLQGAKYELVKE